MNERRFHGINSNFNPTLRELLNKFDDRQHRVNFYRVIARHSNVNGWFHNKLRCAAMMIKGLESDGAPYLFTF